MTTETTFTFPAFHIPFPTTCNPAVAETEIASVEWAERHGITPDERLRARLARAKFASLVGRAYPNADAELYQIISDMMVWVFTYDDTFSDRIPPESAMIVPAIARSLNVLDLGQGGDGIELDQHGPYESAFTDICQRLRARTTIEQYERFAQGMRLFFIAQSMQSHRSTRADPPSMAEYEAIRRYVGGTHAFFGIIDAANGETLGDGEFYHPDMQRLALHANNVVVWANDVFSLPLEAIQPGRFWSMPLLYVGQGCSVEEAVDRTVNRVGAEADAFQALAARVEPEASDAGRAFIGGLRHWMRGNHDWCVIDSERYDAAYAADDADDTPAGVS